MRLAYLATVEQYPFTRWSAYHETYSALAISHRSIVIEAVYKMMLHMLVTKPSGVMVKWNDA